MNDSNNIQTETGPNVVIRNGQLEANQLRIRRQCFALGGIALWPDAPPFGGYHSKPTWHVHLTLYRPALNSEMNAARFNTTLWNWTLVTARRRRLFQTIPERRLVRVWVKEIARGKGIGVHHVNVQDQELNALLEFAEGTDSQAEEVFHYMKATLEKALLAKNPTVLGIFDGQNHFERAEKL